RDRVYLLELPSAEDKLCRLGVDEGSWDHKWPRRLGFPQSTAWQQLHLDDRFSVFQRLPHHLPTVFAVPCWQLVLIETWQSRDKRLKLLEMKCLRVQNLWRGRLCHPAV